MDFTFIGDEARKRPRRGSPLRDLVFETADGYMTVATISDAEWEGFARVIGRPELVEDSRFRTGTSRVINWDERLQLMGDALRTDTTARWLSRLDAEQVPCAPILGRRDLLTDPQIAANELIVESDHPQVGRLRQTRPAARFEGTPSEIRRPAPTLGQHTDEVLAELGLADSEISVLRESGAIA
jgi:crotonobetainyl-CoA:carnitine CoA-transferase CaiB-like acyl-CoA transferase